MPELGKRNATTISYVPIALGAVLKATGNSSPMAVPAKGNYMAIELRRWAKRYAVPFRANPHPFMRSTMRLVRRAVPAQKLGVFAAYHEAAYLAVGAGALDLGDEPTLGAGGRQGNRRAGWAGVTGAD